MLSGFYNPAEEVFAAGVILSDPEPSDFAQFKKLMGHLKHITGMQKYRVILQSILFIAMFILLGIMSEKEWILEDTTIKTLMNTGARATMFLSGCIFG